MAIQKDIVINRKEYQNIKKKDHNQMNVRTWRKKSS